MTDEFDARLKGVRRDFTTEVENLNGTLGKIAKQVRDKADTDDVTQIARKVSDVESDARDAIKAMKSELHDTRQSLTRGIEGLVQSMTVLSDSLATYRREADGRTIDTVNRMLSERKPNVSGPVWALGGAASGGGVAGLILYVLQHMGAN